MDTLNTPVPNPDDLSAWTGHDSTWHTMADVNDLTQNYDTWLSILHKRFDNISSAWQAANADAEQDFATDLDHLDQRWIAAKTLSAADKVADVASLPVTLFPAALAYLYAKVHGGTLADALPAETVYRAYVSAIRQGGEGAVEQKGDYTDLLTRLTEEENTLGVIVPASLAHPATIQPTSIDASTSFLKDTNTAPKPDELVYWGKVIAAAVVAGFTLNLINTMVTNAALLKAAKARR
jgi:hypothetical protein